MGIFADRLAHAAEAVGTALAAVTWPVHVGPVPAKVVAPPCILVGVPRAVEQVGTLACPEWRFTVPVLCIAADTTGRDLYDMASDAMHALWASSIATTAEPRQYQPEGKPAALPAVEITAT